MLDLGLSIAGAITEKSPVIVTWWSLGSPKQTAFELGWLSSSLPATRPEL